MNDRRRALMAMKKSKLPEEYQQVEYIECENVNGSVAYLDLPPTAFLRESRITILIKQKTQTSEELGFLGRQDNSGAFELYYQDGVIMTYGRGISGLAVTYGDTFDVVSATKVNYDANVLLLMQYRPDRYFFSGRCFRAYVELEGSRLIDLIPCYRKSDNVVGMYDIVSGTFFTSAGSGIFTKGGNV